MNKLKIALVKQEVYQDLYVCPVTEKDPGQILFSSMGRVGPIALMSDLNADFYIVKEESKPKRWIKYPGKNLKVREVRTRTGNMLSAAIL